LAAGRSRWKSFMEGLCSYTGNDDDDDDECLKSTESVYCVLLDVSFSHSCHEYVILQQSYALVPLISAV
jgi:hypothetical protein